MRFFSFVILGFLLAFSVKAQADYTVTVAVDVEAEDSVKAKEAAMSEAQRKAFLEAAKNLTDDKNLEKLAELSDAEILRFINSVGVDNEKAGGTKYIADLTVEIKDDLLKNYLMENEMITVKKEELLIIPVFKINPRQKPLLWGKENLWRQHWLSKGLIRFGALQMYAIGEHFRNIKELDGESALFMDSKLLKEVVSINGSDKIYLAEAEVLNNGDLKVIIKNQKSGDEESFAIYNDKQSDVFDKAIEKSVMFIANMERNSYSAEKAPAVNSVNCVYIYQNMKDWLEKSKTFAALENVDAIDTKSFGGGKVNFAIRYRGSLDDLWTAMQEEGFSHEAVGNYFIIR